MCITCGKMRNKKSPPLSPTGILNPNRLELVSGFFIGMFSGMSSRNDFASGSRQFRAVSESVFAVRSRRFCAVSGNNECCIAFNDDFRAVSEGVFNRSNRSGVSGNSRSSIFSVYRERSNCDQGSSGKSKNAFHSMYFLKVSNAAPLPHELNHYHFPYVSQDAKMKIFFHLRTIYVNKKGN